MAPAPETYIQEGGQPPPPLRFESLSAVLLAGAAATGPLNAPQVVLSVGDYKAAFGGDPPVTWLDHGVRQFFDNGGQEAVVLRLTGEPGAAVFHAGLRAAIENPAVVSALRNIGIISIPGLSDTATMQVLQSFARREGKFLVIDSAESGSIDQVRHQSSALKNGNSLNSALYFPWISYPAASLPPGPAVAGIMARLDKARGCWQSPSGTAANVAGATGLAQVVVPADMDVLNAEGICCLRRDAGASRVLVWGGRTLAQEDGSEWKYIAVRRLALALEQSLANGFSWVVFEPNEEPLWASLRLVVGNLLHELFRAGALQGRTPRDAYFVRCGLGQTMTAVDVTAGRVVVEIGFAPLKPAEFITLRIVLRTQPI